MGDTGGKSGRRPGRHLQVEASGPGNAAGVQQRLAGRFRGGEIAQGRACAVWLKVDAPELSSGPICEIHEVSRVGAQGVTSKSKLWQFRVPGACFRRRTRFRNALVVESAKGRRKGEKRLGSATSPVSVRSLTPPLQLFKLEGPQRAASVASKPVLYSRLHISGFASIAAGGEVPSYIDHVVRPGYKRPRAHAVG